MDVVTLRWGGKRQFVSWDKDGHSIIMDASSEYKGEGTGIRPLQVFLQGLAGCTGMDVISILEKKRQDVRALEIDVEADQRTDEYPKIYTDIRLHFRVTGFRVKSVAVARSIELSEEKYCSVGGMLGPQTTVHTSYEIIEADPGSTGDE